MKKTPVADEKAKSRFQSILAAAEKQVREGQGIPHDEFWQEVESEKK